MLEKALGHKLSQLKEKIIEQRFFVKKWEAKELLYLEPTKYRPFSHKIQKVNQMSKESVIAQTEITLPQNMVDKKVYINIPVESAVEALLILNNKPVAGIDRFHNTILLGSFEETKPKIKIEGKMTSYEWEGLKKGIYLFTVNDKIEKYYFDLNVAYEIFQNSKDTSLKMSLWKILENSASAFNLQAPDFERGIRNGQRILSEGLQRLSQIYKPMGKISLIAHSHIDVAWHWELKETIRKSARTFSTAINLMKEYPSFYFPSSQIQLYAYTKKYYPQVYFAIKERVKKGAWELIGGSWVEGDCNIPSGESIVRQHLYGQRFFEKEFGKRTEISWMPDTFGFSGNLPQILAGCGMKYFFTWKMYWQSRDLFPYNLFFWEGIDGSRILAHTPRLISAYSGCATPKELFAAWENFSEKNICDEMVSTYGYGDGGGGVTREMLEYAKRYKHFPGFPECKIERADKFFRRIDKKIRNNITLPVWKGEIYLETHQGTFISKAILKTLNRKTENLFLDAEKISSLLMAHNIKPELTEIDKGWRNILLNQFHDIMAGTSEKEVNDDAVKYYQDALAIGSRIIEKNMEKLGKVIDTSDISNPTILFNTLSWNRDDIVEIRLNKIDKKTCIVDENSEELDYQVIDKKENKILVFAKNIPALGYKILDVKEKNGRKEKGNNIKVSTRLMENDFYKITINDSGEVKIYDKVRKRDVFEEGRWGNVLEFFRENPDPEAAWNIDRDFAKHRDTVKNAKISIKETGPVRASICVEKRYHNSTIIQEIRTYKDIPRIDFKTRVDWQERNVMLKASFPVNVNSLRATFEIPYGNIERPTHTNTSWDQEKYEVPAQRWADLSEFGFGVSILNDSKYSYDIRNNLMRITLLRSPNYPELDADKGLHEFCYSLVTHNGDWRKGGIVRGGYQFNFPVIARGVKPHQGRLTPSFSLAKVDPENVIIEVVKKSEDSDSLIVRLYEYFGARGNVNLSLGFDVKELYETNLLENKKRKFNLTGRKNKVSFFIKPYEIKTFKLHPHLSPPPLTGGGLEGG